jgi:hypothetical protein
MNYSFTFTTAGRFNYSSTFSTDTQHGQITVTPKAPASVVNGNDIVIDVATLYPAGVTTNVQVKTPGAPGFVSAATGVNTNTFTYHPVAGTGAYRFQVQTASGGNTSGWSPTITVTVTP